MVLSSFTKQPIDYTFKEVEIDILMKVMVEDWAAGNSLREVTRNIIAKLHESQKNRRRIAVDGASLSPSYCLCFRSNRMLI